MTDEAPTPFQVADGDVPADVIAECEKIGARRTNDYGKHEYYVSLPRRPEPCWMSENILVLCLTTKAI